MDKPFKLIGSLLLALFLFSLNVTSTDFLVVDYETMIGINNSHVRVYTDFAYYGLYDECFTDVLGQCSFDLTTSNYTIITSADGYITETTLGAYTNDSNIIIKLQNITTYALVTLELDDLGLNYQLCIDNLTQCYSSGETITLTEKKDYAIILMPDEYNITISELPTLFENTVFPMLTLLLIILVVFVLFYMMKKHIIR